MILYLFEKGMKLILTFNYGSFSIISTAMLSF